MVGADVGTGVVGNIDGDLVGLELVGFSVGETVGSEVVGEKVGDVEGDAEVGAAVGGIVGDVDGAMVSGHVSHRTRQISSAPVSSQHRARPTVAQSPGSDTP